MFMFDSLVRDLIVIVKEDSFDFVIGRSKEI